MDTENCTNLYLQVCQTFLTCKYDDPATFEDIYKLLSWLRQSLTCCVCASVVTNPMSSTQSHCQHFVCAKCKGGKMILRPSCSWCKDSEAFEPNPRLQALVNCFKKICQLIHSSPIREHILKYDKQKKKELQATKIEPSRRKETIKTRKNRVKKYPRQYVSNSLLNRPVDQVLKDGMSIVQVEDASL